MASVNIKEVNGGEDTTPAGTDAIEIDNGTTSMWVLLSNLYKALGTGTATAAKALMGDGAWTTVTTPNSTETMTNKRITKRVASTTDDATAVIDSDSYDEYYLTAVANATEYRDGNANQWAGSIYWIQRRWGFKGVDMDRHYRSWSDVANSHNG